MSSIDTIIIRIHKISTTHCNLASVIQKKKKIHSQEILNSKIEDSQYEKILKQGTKKQHEKTTSQGRKRMQTSILETIAKINKEKHNVNFEDYDINQKEQILNEHELELVRNSDDKKGALLHFLEEKKNNYNDDDLFNTMVELLHDKEKSKEVITIRKYTKNNKTTLVPNSIFGKIGSNSHHYDIRFKVDWSNDFLELEFSIPKALYGTNVFQNIYHKQRGVYSETEETANIDWQINYITTFLKTQLSNIFFSYFHISTADLDFKEIELVRIDLCFNQVFKSKDIALTYLEYQKSCQKKWSRDEHKTIYNQDMNNEKLNRSNYVPRSTSVSFTTKSSSFKIYHKGSEFEKHDSRQLRKVNRQRFKNGEQPIDIEKLQAFSDRILRYEITYRASALSRIYKNHFHCKISNGTEENEEKNIQYSQLKKDVNRWKYLYEKHGGGINKYELKDNKIQYKYIYENRLGKRVRIGKEKIYKKSFIEYKKIIDSTDERHRLISWSKWFDKVARCFLDNNIVFNNGVENTEKRHKNTNLTYDHENMFDRFVLTPDFLKCLFNDFQNKVNEFKLEQMTDETAFIQKVVEKNIQIQKNLDIDSKRKLMNLPPLKWKYHEKNKYNIGTMKLLYFLVSQKDFKQIENEKMFPDSTWKRHKSRLKELGITDKNSFVPVKMPRFDHYNYQNYLHHNKYLLQSMLKGYKYLRM